MHKIRHDAQDAGKPCIPKILNYPLHHAACDHAYSVPCIGYQTIATKVNIMLRMRR